jgi:hypothetical protein
MSTSEAVLSRRDRALRASVLKQKLIGWFKKAGIFPKSGLISRSFFHPDSICLMGKKR